MSDTGTERVRLRGFVRGFLTTAFMAAGYVAIVAALLAGGAVAFAEALVRNVELIFKLLAFVFFCFGLFEGTAYHAWKSGKRNPRRGMAILGVVVAVVASWIVVPKILDGWLEEDTISAQPNCEPKYALVIGEWRLSFGGNCDADGN